MALVQLKLLGFDLVRIRRSLVKLTGTTEPELARKMGVSRQYVSHTLMGRRVRKELQQGIANIWEIPREELFDASEIRADQPH